MTKKWYLVVMIFIVILSTLLVFSSLESPVGIDVVVLVPLTKIADESYWHWLETGELPPEVIDCIAEWNGYYLVGGNQMKLKEKLKESIAKRQAIIDQVNATADEIESLRQKRQALLQEALRMDGEVRTLEALIKEEEATK